MALTDDPWSGTPQASPRREQRPSVEVEVIDIPDGEEDGLSPNIDAVPASLSVGQSAAEAVTDEDSFHDRFLAACAMVKASPLGQKHQELMPYGIMTIKLSTLSLLMLKFAGWFPISWFWVFAPIWGSLLLAFLLPLGLLVAAMFLGRKRHDPL